MRRGAARGAAGGEKGAKRGTRCCGRGEVDNPTHLANEQIFPAFGQCSGPFASAKALNRHTFVPIALIQLEGLNPEFRGSLVINVPKSFPWQAGLPAALCGTSGLGHWKFGSSTESVPCDPLVLQCYVSRAQLWERLWESGGGGE